MTGHPVVDVHVRVLLREMIRTLPRLADRRMILGHHFLRGRCAALFRTWKFNFFTRGRREWFLYLRGRRVKDYLSVSCEQRQRALSKR